MKINCVSCGHNISLDEAYDDFEGPVKCYVCGTRLEVKICKGKIKCVKFAAPAPGSLPKPAMEVRAENGL
jgi:hypothetical protein